MTINKAIDIIKCLAWHRRPDEEDIEQAIKALEQQPEDAISRQAALDIYDDYNVAVENGELEAYRKYRKRLLKLPPVQPKYNTSEWCHDCSEYNQDKHCCPRFNRVIRNAVEGVKKPKVGHWIYLKHDKARCSECDDVVLIAQMYGNANYCPNCGAKMVEPQAESE